MKTAKEARKLLKELIKKDKGNPRRAIVAGMYGRKTPYSVEELSREGVNWECNKRFQG